MPSTTAVPRLFFDQEEVADFPTLLEKFGPGALASPYRSTVPLLCLVKDAPSVFAQIATTCGCRDPLSIHFEYEVAVPGVEGNPSQTDAMVVSSACSVAIEAKWTEPRYETVATRLRSRVAKLERDEPENSDKHTASQRAVISAWLRLLGSRGRTPLGIEQAGEAVYQMIHRAASACQMPGNVALVYLLFEPSPAKGTAHHSQYRTDLVNLRRLIGDPEQFPFYLVSVTLRPTAAFEEIKGLPKRKAATDSAIRDALAGSELFEFDAPHIERLD